MNSYALNFYIFYASKEAQYHIFAFQVKDTKILNVKEPTLVSWSTSHGHVQVPKQTPTGVPQHTHVVSSSSFYYPTSKDLGFLPLSMCTWPPQDFTYIKYNRSSRQQECNEMKRGTWCWGKTCDPLSHWLMKYIYPLDCQHNAVFLSFLSFFDNGCDVVLRYHEFCFSPCLEGAKANFNFGQKSTCLMMKQLHHSYTWFTFSQHLDQYKFVGGLF